MKWLKGPKASKKYSEEARPLTMPMALQGNGSEEHAQRWGHSREAGGWNQGEGPAFGPMQGFLRTSWLRIIISALSCRGNGFPQAGPSLQPHSWSGVQASGYWHQQRFPCFPLPLNVWSPRALAVLPCLARTLHSSTQWTYTAWKRQGWERGRFRKGHLGWGGVG